MRKRSQLPDVFHQFAVLFRSITSSLRENTDLDSDRVAEFSAKCNRIKRTHDDIAKEYASLQTDFGRKVMKTFSPPYTPQMNATAEPINRTLCNAAGSMLIPADLPTEVWPFAMKNVVYIKNRVPHSTTGSVPFELLRGNKASSRYAKVFGCMAYVLRQPEGGKLEPRAIEGVLLEVMDHGIYKVLILRHDDLYSIVESRHVTLDETCFPGAADLHHVMDDDRFGDGT